MAKRDKLHLEILRIAAIFLVIFTHTDRRGFAYYLDLEPSVKRWLCMIPPIVCRICVPLFYMISGATLLQKDETPGQIWRRRIPRFAAVLVLASGMAYLYSGKRDVLEFLKGIYTEPVIIPYWYLYSYLSFLMVLPLLRRMIRGMNRREFHYLAGMSLLFTGVIPVAAYRLSGGSMWLTQEMNLYLLTNILVVYPAMGYYLEQRENLSWRQIGWLWGLSVLALILTMYMTDYKIRLTGEVAEGKVTTFYGGFRLLPTFSLYATVKKFTSQVRFPQWLRPWIFSLGGCSFGIYLVEQMIRLETRPLRDAAARYIPNMAATVLWVLLIMALGHVLTLAAKKLPVLRKLL